MKRKEEKREKREIKKRGKKEEKKSRRERKKEREREREKEKERVRVEKKREAYVFCIQLRPVRRAVETRGRIVSAATVVSLAAAFRLAMTFFRDAAPVTRTTRSRGSSRGREGNGSTVIHVTRGQSPLIVVKRENRGKRVASCFESRIEVVSSLFSSSFLPSSVHGDRSTMSRRYAAER